MSGAIFSEDFITLLKLHQNLSFAPNGGVEEFSKILDILCQRRKRPRLALEQTTLWNRQIGTEETACLTSLTPSSATVIDGHLNIGKLLQEMKGQILRAPQTNRNDRSIVLWVRVENAIVLLGSDLGEVGDPGRGWSAVLLSGINRPKAQVFKVPHHGSPTSDLDAVWSDLLHPK